MRWRQLLAAAQTCPPPPFESGRLPFTYVFYITPKNRALASPPYSPRRCGSGRLRGEQRPPPQRDGATLVIVIACRPLSTRPPSRRSFSFFLSRVSEALVGREKPLSVLCRVSAVGLSDFARRACALAAASLIFRFPRSLWRHRDAAA